MADHASTEGLTTKGMFARSFYPKGHLVAAFDDREAAEAAVGELAKRGISGGQTKVWERDEFLALADQLEREKGPLQKLTEALETEQGKFQDEYFDLARRGATIVTAYAPEDDDVDRAAEMLAAHGGHTIRSYGTFAIRNLATGGTPASEP